MARIPEDELERLKQEVSLERLAEARGISLKRHGSDLLGLCPFHDDHEPSLVISPDKNLWHCLGACQCGGTVIDWVIKSEGVSFRHAVELLRTDPSLAASGSGTVKHCTVTKLPTPLQQDAEDQAVLMQVVDYYHETLQQSPEAQAYLEERGIASRDAIDHFKLGFANRSLGYRLPKKNRKEGAAMRGRLQRLGILRSSGHEHFNGSLVIPIINDHLVTEVYGRKITPGLRPGTPLHLYLPGPHKGVFNAEALQTSKEIILCESLIDALTFWCAGYRHVTCSYGIEGFSKEHLQAFKDYGTERVLVAYDRDKAGEQAAETLAKKLITEGIDCYRIHFPKGMDANEYACQVQPAGKSMGVVIRSAIWLGKGKPPAKPSAVANEVEIKAATKKEKKAENPLPSLAAVVDEPQPLPASPLPEPPNAETLAEVTDEEIIMAFGDRRYRIRGLQKNLSYDQLKVNVLVSCDEQLHIDTFDLYAARPRALYIKQAAIELNVTDEVIKKDVGKVLLKLEALQEQHIKKTLEPKATTVTFPLCQASCRL